MLPNPDSFWCSLALCAKHVLAKEQKSSKPVVAKGNIQVKYKENIIRERVFKDAEQESIKVYDNKIIIPATGCSEPRKSTNSVQFTKSFLGGQQLHHAGGDSFEYTLTHVSDEQVGTYVLTLRVCTVHLKQVPLLLTIASSTTNKKDSITIVVPYTVGEWQYTDPVDIQLSLGTNILRFSRETPNFGLSIKDIVCTMDWAIVST